MKDFDFGVRNKVCGSRASGCTVFSRQVEGL